MALRNECSIKNPGGKIFILKPDGKGFNPVWHPLTWGEKLTLLPDQHLIIKLSGVFRTPYDE
jgi:hypothetical protein